MDIKAAISKMENTAGGDSAITQVTALTASLRKIDEELTQLERLGYRFELVERDSPEPQAYPKMIYHDEHARNGLVVNSADHEQHVKESAEGWRDHPTEVDNVALADDPETPAQITSVGDSEPTTQE